MSFYNTILSYIIYNISNIFNIVILLVSFLHCSHLMVVFICWFSFSFLFISISTTFNGESDKQTKYRLSENIKSYHYSLDDEPGLLLRR